MLKHKIGKGANRICTFLYFYLRRLKFFDTRQKLCRKLVCMADNYIENKCNVFLIFLCHLVHWQWFDTIELVFGPVGHTHNGNDSVHNCHIVILTSYPEGIPDILKSTIDPDVVQKVVRDLAHSSLIDLTESAGLRGGLTWLRQVMTDGAIPTQGPTRNLCVSRSAHFGSVEVVGVGDRLIDLPIVRPLLMTKEEMFQLPHDSLEARRGAN